MYYRINYLNYTYIMERVSKLLQAYDKEKWTNLDAMKPVWDVHEQTQKEIRNILWNTNLSGMLIALTKHGVAWDLTDNLINTFEIERELKILEVDKEALIQKLEWLWAQRVFEWVIDDIYLDYTDSILENAPEKTSFRIRIKVDIYGKIQVYYTIKKKLKDQNIANIRSCYEKEFQLHNPWLFCDMLVPLGIHVQRRKMKERVSLVLWNSKYDIDTYEGIPSVLEIETDSAEKAEGIIEVLGLSEYERLITGSNGLLKHYNIDNSHLISWDKLSLSHLAHGYLKVA